MRVLIALMVAVVLGVVGWVVLAMKWSYSSGDRAGWVQNFSKKGWLCKTWEGELAIMVLMPGAVPEKFFFTVWDDRVAEQVNAAMGRRVTLHYEEKVGLPSSCFGDTRSWVTRVTVVEDIPSVVPGAPGLQTQPLPSSPLPTLIPAPSAPSSPPTNLPSSPTPAPMTR